ncbi:MAG: radical SAM protein [Nitrososphaerales archaeon]
MRKLAPIIRFLGNQALNQVSISKRPMYGFILATEGCNSRCTYCGFWKTRMVDEPSTEEWKRILDDMRELGVTNVTWSGGEPLLRRDLFELAKYSYDIGMMNNLVTNFIVFKESMIEPMSEYFVTIGISIDSHRPEIYRELRGVDWLPRIIENFGKLRKGLVKRQSSTFTLALNTVTALNIDSTHDLIHYLMDDISFDSISFQLVDTEKGGLDTYGKPNDYLEPSGEQIERFRRLVREHKKQYPIINSGRYLDQFGAFDYDCNPWKCIQIDSHGYLQTPCLRLAKDKGRKINLREQRLADIWKSKDVQNIYRSYNECNLCNYYCVVDTAWTSTDFTFFMNDLLLGITLPLRRRIGQRNNAKISPGRCDYYNSEPPKMYLPVLK